MPFKKQVTSCLTLLRLRLFMAASAFLFFWGWMPIRAPANLPAILTGRSRGGVDETKTYASNYCLRVRKAPWVSSDHQQQQQQEGAQLSEFTRALYSVHGLLVLNNVPNVVYQGQCCSHGKTLYTGNFHSLTSNEIYIYIYNTFAEQKQILQLCIVSKYRPQLRVPTINICEVCQQQQSPPKR